MKSKYKSHLQNNEICIWRKQNNCLTDCTFQKWHNNISGPTCSSRNFPSRDGIYSSSRSTWVRLRIVSTNRKWWDGYCIRKAINEDGSQMVIQFLWSRLRIFTTHSVTTWRSSSERTQREASQRGLQGEKLKSLSGYTTRHLSKCILR